MRILPILQPILIAVGLPGQIAPIIQVAVKFLESLRLFC